MESLRAELREVAAMCSEGLISVEEAAELKCAALQAHREVAMAKKQASTDLHGLL